MAQPPAQSPANIESPGTATVEVLLISPIIPDGLLQTSRKRKITPLCEASTPKQIAVVTNLDDVKLSGDYISRSVLPNSLGWPASATHARIDSKQSFLSGRHFRGFLEPQHFSRSARHIVLLSDPPVSTFTFSNREAMEIVMSIFPETRGAAMDSTFLYLHLRRMPDKPWPKTIAGLPIYFAARFPRESSPASIGMAFPRRGFESIAEDIGYLEIADWEPLFHIIKGHFQDLRISITEVMYWGHRVVIILEHRDTDITKLLHKAANVQCSYFYDDEMGKYQVPQAHRRRHLDPRPGNPDNSEYETLQPGLRASSTYRAWPTRLDCTAPVITAPRVQKVAVCTTITASRGSTRAGQGLYPPSLPGEFLSTTTGVLVKDESGKEYMTASSDGFPAECMDIVIHPEPTSGRCIGKRSKEVEHTGIALVELQDGEKFSNTTFQSQIFDATQLKSLARAKLGKGLGSVYLDSPDTGCIEGSLMCTSFQRVPNDDSTSTEHEWVFTTWAYMGQESADFLPDRMRGSSIWTEEGDVVGFFKYAPQQGVMKDYCAGIAADELIKRGFTLVDTSGRVDI